MSELEWSVIGGIVALALAGLTRIAVGRILSWRRERSREPLRAPFKLQEFTDSDGVAPVPATEDGPAGRRQQRAANGEEQRSAPSALSAPPATEGGEAGSKGIASEGVTSAPGDLCPGNGPKGPPEDQEPAGIEAAEQQLRQLQVRLNREKARFEQLTEASGDELTRALLKHGVSSVADGPHGAQREAQGARARRPAARPEAVHREWVGPQARGVSLAPLGLQRRGLRSEWCGAAPRVAPWGRLPPLLLRGATLLG